MLFSIRYGSFTQSQFRLERFLILKLEKPISIHMIGDALQPKVDFGSPFPKIPFPTLPWSFHQKMEGS